MGPNDAEVTGRPVLLTVEAGAERMDDLRRELFNRYEPDYRVHCVASADEALDALRTFATAGEQVALVLAGEMLGDRPGTQLLGAVHDHFPQAQRALLVGWGRLSDSTGVAVLDAISHGLMDHFVLRPSEPPDEKFHQAVSGFLLAWAESRSRAPYTVDVVGETWSGRAYELREVLERCALPHRFVLAGSDEGRDLLAAHRGARLPALVMPDGRVLEDPSDSDIASASGTAVEPNGDLYDVVVVGAGPAGLSAGVYGASEGLRTLVLDAGGLGGQATSSAAIRNYMGFPRGVSGGELARRAYEQAWVFGTRFGFMQRAVSLTCEDGTMSVALHTGGLARGRVVVLATGARYRRLGVRSLEALRGAGVYYGAAASEAPLVSGDDVYVVGGANSAGQAALHLARYARSVTLVVRASSLDAGMSHYLVREVTSTRNIVVRTGTQVADGGGDGRLEHLVLRGHDGQQETVSAQALFLMIGAQPHTDWLPDSVERDASGFVVTGADLGDHVRERLGRMPGALETSLPGVLAVGDVRHGSVKRVASAVGEGSVAIRLVHGILGG